MWRVAASVRRTACAVVIRHPVLNGKGHAPTLAATSVYILPVGQCKTSVSLVTLSAFTITARILCIRVPPMNGVCGRRAVPFQHVHLFRG
mmetsp:Transcript_96848/g.172353  ORF Transcript_96848/g.172353 Transcript_96848/m.172353 type:complete len:90 (-) Transcript_96848:599-868(-)